MTTPAGGERVIEVSDLRRDFGGVPAIDGISLSVGPGEVVGLLGHNGAGKTTLVRLLAGLLSPTAGRIRVGGLDPLTDGVTVRRSLGVLPTVSFVDGRLTARRNLEFAAELFDLPRDGLADLVTRSLAEFELSDRADDRVDGFSAGMRQRLALARVLLPSPRILLLDEPTAQLDPLAVRLVRSLIGRLSREDGRTVVLCTHDLTEAQLLCDRVIVLDHGTILAEGAPARLAADLAAGAVEVEVGGHGAPRARAVLDRYTPAPRDAATAMDRRPALQEIPGPAGAGTVVFRTTGLARAQVPGLVRDLTGAGVEVYGIRPHEPSLEDVYVALLAHRDGRRASGPDPAERRLPAPDLSGRR